MLFDVILCNLLNDHVDLIFTFIRKLNILNQVSSLYLFYKLLIDFAIWLPRE